MNQIRQGLTGLTFSETVNLVSLSEYVGNVTVFITGPTETGIILQFNTGKMTELAVDFSRQKTPLHIFPSRGVCGNWTGLQIPGRRQQIELG